MNSPEKLTGMEKVAVSLLQRMADEPSSKDILYGILTFCEKERTTEEIVEEINRYTQNRVLLQRPQTLITWLIEEGGLESVVNTEELKVWRTTSAGIHAVRFARSPDWFENLSQSDPEYIDIYLMVMESCIEDKTKDEIEAILECNLMLEEIEILPSFFIATLEEAGGLEWNGKWKTTSSGKKTLEVITN